jgi:6-phosphogluconolactonase
MKRYGVVFLVQAIILACALLLSVANGAAQGVRKSGYIVYVGTYTGQQSRGIYAFRFDPAAGKATTVELAAETANPSFLAIHPNRRFLYAVNEISAHENGKSGSISAYSIDPGTCRLHLLNVVSSRGGSPCHLTVDKIGQYLFVANYGNGSVAVFPVNQDGTLGEASEYVQHTGSSVNPQRQQGPHAHQILLSADNRFALVPDLGLDKVFVYRVDAAKAGLSPNNPQFVKLEPGAGPRHAAFHPNGRFVYVINEMRSTITAFSYDLDRGILQELQNASTLPEDFTGSNTCAEIAVHQSGRFLYGSNRGQDSIAVFSVDGGKGTLKLTEQVSTQGKLPRNFAIDPTGGYLFAANQGSGSVVVFRIDRSTGHLTATGEVLEVPSPVCVTFLDSK